MKTSGNKLSAQVISLTNAVDDMEEKDGWQLFPRKIFCGIDRVTKHIPANRIYGIMEYHPQVMFK